MATSLCAEGVEVRSQPTLNKPLSAILSESKRVVFSVQMAYIYIYELAENLSCAKWPGSVLPGSLLILIH